MPIPRSCFPLAAFSALAAVLLAACGGEAATATPLPTATPAARPSATPVLATATARLTPSPGQPTPSAATPTPVSSGPPTPVKAPAGRRGGVLQSSVLPSYIDFYDTFSAGGKAAVPGHNLFLNNLIWADPYGDGKTIVGDAASGWTISADGKSITFTIHRGITFHDGKPLTSKDVAYNIDRAWHPRSPTMTEFKGRLDPLQAIETPDDYTVRLTLSQPSNFLLVALSNSQFLIYPASMPLPESNEQWKATATGSGPFKLKQRVAATKIETVRNDGYWKAGLPYLDGVLFNAIADPSLVAAGYRSGRLDATSLDYLYIPDLIADGTLQKEQGFLPHKVVQGQTVLQFNQKAPWTDPRVREAVDLALDRATILAAGVKGLGTQYASPLLTPELGGEWGISEKELATRPGFRTEKAQDVARAKQLLKDAGVDPSTVQTRLTVTNSPATKLIAEATEGSIRDLGFKTELQPVETARLTQSRSSGAYETTMEPLNIQADDPSDYLAIYVKTGAGSNFAKWSDPTVDKLFENQDRTLDAAKRRQMLRDLQEVVLTDRHTLFLHWKTIFTGGNRYVKNYPPNLRFTFDSRFRWEQVWLER